MTTTTQITDYINSQPEQKRLDMYELHRIIQELNPDGQLWFMDGKNEENKVVSNPNIGYGFQILQYADGSTKDFYQIGISANTTGISVYILGIEDKTFLSKTYGDTIGKATMTSYCIKFKKLQDLNIETLKAALRYGIQKR